MNQYGSTHQPIHERLNAKAISNASLLAAQRPSYRLDDVLLAALKEGHREFLRVAIRRTHSLNAGEMLVREFYREAIRSDYAIKEGRGFKGWLIQALRRALAGYQQRCASATGAPEAQFPNLDEPLPIWLDDVERAVSSCLYRILPALPKDCSWLIWQVDLLGQPFEAVAKKAGVAPETLAVRVQRACRTLLGALERFSMTCPNHGFLNCTCEQSLENHAAL
jgi:DNA-directed RNA polymerase specialized sigma24 family protein